VPLRTVTAQARQLHLSTTARIAQSSAQISKQSSAQSVTEEDRTLEIRRREKLLRDVASDITPVATLLKPELMS